VRGSRATRSAPQATQRPTPQPAEPREAEAAPEDPVKENSTCQQRKPAAKLETFSGQGASVEAFLAKFESHATYFGWSERDRVFQLKNSLTGTAAQALWTGGENATSAGPIEILHSRQGSKLPTAPFWAKLRARRRRKNEPLQELCHDIRRLMHLACPNEIGPLAEHISIDIFTTALNEHDIRMFVMARDPITLESALTHSLRYEAINLGNPVSTHTAASDTSAYIYDDKGRKRDIANVRGVEVQEAQHHNPVQTTLLEIQRKLADREAELAQWQSAWNTEQTRL